jgi:hypothetical protein
MAVARDRSMKALIISGHVRELASIAGAAHEIA